MNELLIQIVANAICFTLFGFSNVLFFITVGIFFIILILSALYNPVGGIEALNEGFALWRIGLAIIMCFIFTPFGEWLRTKFDKWRFKNG